MSQSESAAMQIEHVPEKTHEVHQGQESLHHHHKDEKLQEAPHELDEKRKKKEKEGEVNLANKTESQSSKHGKPDYHYTHFNRDNKYELKDGWLQNVKNKLADREAVYQNKETQSLIKISKDKIDLSRPNPDDIRATVDLAKDKGWKTLRINGGRKQDRALMWFEAQMRGIETKGYKPTQEDFKKLAGAQERAKQAVKQKTAQKTQGNTYVNIRNKTVNVFQQKGRRKSPQRPKMPKAKER